MESLNFDIPVNKDKLIITENKKIKLAENIYKLDDDNDDNNNNDNNNNDNDNNDKLSIIDFKTNINITKKNSICFATMCKNEENCIRDTLENIYKYIDYWIISDTGSTDNTCKIIKDFFKEKNIPGELHHDEWISFDKNKTKLFNYCYKKTDYILHLDADDLLEGDFEFKDEDAGKIKYNCLCKRGSSSSITFQVIFMFNNHYHWKFCGVAHTIIRCLDNHDNIPDGYFIDRNFYLNSRDKGNRSLDSEKYYKDAIILSKQFFDTLIDDPDNLNSRSVFYTAQSYFDCQKYEESAKWYSLYTKLNNTWIEETFESYLRLGLIYRILKYNNDLISQMYMMAINIFNDRAEPYLELGTFYNQNRDFQKAYDLLIKAKEISFEEVKKKYLLYINSKSYGKYINDELSVSCYWIGKYNYSINLIEEIINDLDFKEHRERLFQNLHYSLDKIGETNDISFNEENPLIINI